MGRPLIGRAAAALAAMAVGLMVAAPAAAADSTATTAPSPVGEAFSQVTITGGGIGAQSLSLPTHEGNVLVGQFLGAVLIGNPHAVPAPPDALRGAPIQVVAQPNGTAASLKLLWVPRADDTGGWWHILPPQKLDLPTGAWDFQTDGWVPFTTQAFAIVDKRLHPEKYVAAPAPKLNTPVSTGHPGLRVLLISSLAALATAAGVVAVRRRGLRHRVAA
jgi:hypothetical protein